MTAQQRTIIRSVLDETGVTSIEYALAASLIAVVCALTVMGVGANLSTLYTSVCNAVCNAVSTAISGAPAC